MNNPVRSDLTIMKNQFPYLTMKYFLFLFLVLFNLTVTAANDNKTSFGDDDVDFSLSNLVLTAVNEKSFQYKFNLTNGGTSEVQGYPMRLTFSADAVLDAGDNFVLLIPLKDDLAQWIGPTQTLAKTEFYNTSSPSGYLPVGAWYIFAEINYDGIVSETDYTNNSVWSTNKITVSNYTIPFKTPPTVTSITDSSFMVNGFFEPDMTIIYYRVQSNGAPAPSKSTMLSSYGMYPWESEITISGLGPAYDYDVYFMGEFYDQKVTVIYKIDVKTLGTNTPTLKLSQNALLLDPTNKNADSSPELYNITGFHLTSNVTVTSSGNFVVSKDNITYTSQVTFLATAFAQGNAQSIYVKYLSDGVAGLKSGSIANASAGAVTKTVALTISVFDPTSGDFNGLTSLEETGWSAYSVTGYHSWSLVDLEESSPHQRVAGNDKAIQIDGSINGFTENEDWLISPETNLSGYLYDPTIKFKSYSSGAGASLLLKYSADYTGSGDPRVATWFDAVIDFPAVNSNEWKKSSTILLNKESKIYFAFVYTSTLTAGTRWTMDDWSILDNLLDIPSTTLSYQNVEVGTSSAPQSLDIQIVGYGNVTVSVSQSFEVSLDNTTFSTSVVIPESQAAARKTIYVRFTPLTQTQGLQGTLTFTANDLAVTKNSLVGSSLFSTATSRPIESTSFIYPNPTNGPVHVDLSSLHNQQGDVPVSIANSMGATVSAFQSSVTSLEINLSDIMSSLKPGLYYITIQGDDAIYRNRLVKE